MKRIEITNVAIVKELNKLNARLERAERKLAKATAAAEKYGVAEMTFEERKEWLSTVETEGMGWIVNKADQKKNGAWFDLHSAKNDVEEVKEMIANAEKRFAESEKAIAEYHKEVEEIESLKEKELLYKREFEAEQKEWAKDGITLEDRYSGTTPNGKHFCILRNSGYSTRSLHCFTLYIDGETIFTSGEFWRAYGIIKNS